MVHHTLRNNFKELDFALVLSILSSELQVFKAADDWMSYKSEERSKFAKDLLLATRLPLLSQPALNSIVNGQSSICKVDECKLLASNVLNKESLNKMPKKSFETRYCDQNSFDILAYNQKDGWTSGIDAGGRQRL